MVLRDTPAHQKPPETSMLIKKIHHVAYRCVNAKETVEWYARHLDMNFVLAIAENEVPVSYTHLTLPTKRIV